MFHTGLVPDAKLKTLDEFLSMGANQPASRHKDVPRSSMDLIANGARGIPHSTAGPLDNPFGGSGALPGTGQQPIGQPSARSISESAHPAGADPVGFVFGVWRGVPGRVWPFTR